MPKSTSRTTHSTDTSEPATVNNPHWRCAVLVSDLTPAQQQTLLWVAETYSDWDTGGSIRPGNTRIARDLAIGRSAAADRVAALVASGWLVVVGECSHAGGRARTYRLGWGESRYGFRAPGTPGGREADEVYGKTGQGCTGKPDRGVRENRTGVYGKTGPTLLSNPSHNPSLSPGSPEQAEEASRDERETGETTTGHEANGTVKTDPWLTFIQAFPKARKPGTAAHTAAREAWDELVGDGYSPDAILDAWNSWKATTPRATRPAWPDRTLTAVSQTLATETASAGSAGSVTVDERRVEAARRDACGLCNPMTGRRTVALSLSEESAFGVVLAGGANSVTRRCSHDEAVEDAWEADALDVIRARFVAARDAVEARGSDSEAFTGDGLARVPFSASGASEGAGSDGFGGVPVPGWVRGGVLAAG